MASRWYNRGAYRALYEGLNGKDLRTLLVKSSYSFDATHNTVSDVVAGSSEISVSGYARYDHATVTIAEDDSNGRAYLDLDDAAFTSLASGQTIGGAVVYIYNASDASAEVVAFLDVADTPTNGGNVTIQWAATSSGAVMYLAT